MLVLSVWRRRLQLLLYYFLFIVCNLSMRFILFPLTMIIFWNHQDFSNFILKVSQLSFKCYFAMISCFWIVWTCPPSIWTGLPFFFANIREPCCSMMDVAAETATTNSPWAAFTPSKMHHRNDTTFSMSIWPLDYQMTLLPNSFCSSIYLKIVFEN